MPYRLPRTILSMGVARAVRLSMAKSWIFSKPHWAARCRIDVHWAVVFSAGRRKSLNEHVRLITNVSQMGARMHTYVGYRMARNSSKSEQLTSDNTHR